MRTIAVFGGTGFLGRRIVQHLADHGFKVRVAARHPEQSKRIFASRTSRIEPVRADVNDDTSVLAAVTGAFGVVNAVSLYAERGDQTFQSVHVRAAANVARHARQSGVERLAHVSGIGSASTSTSRYIRSRGQGEDAVRSEFGAATIVRPAVMFGPGDAFLTPLAKLLRGFPVFPMFGRGRTALQPCFVEDVAEAIVRALDAPEAVTAYELGGPHVYTYESLLRTVADHLGVRPILVPVPFALWQALATAAEMLPHPPVTRNQVELMAVDNVTSPDRPGFKTLGIEPQGLETVLAAITGD